MFHIEDRFKNRFRVPRLWFNRVGSYLNNLCPGPGIHMERPDRPGPGRPVIIEVDPEGVEALGFARTPMFDENTTNATKATCAPAAVAVYKANETDAEKAARVGTSSLAAPLDHVHRLPSTVATTSHVHGNVSSDGKLTGNPQNTQSFVITGTNGSITYQPNLSPLDVKDLVDAWIENGKQFTDFDEEEYYTADDVDTILEDYLTTDDIGVSVAEEDHAHTASDITDWATATADFLTDADLSDYLTVLDIGTTVAAYIHSHNGYASSGHDHGNIGSGGRVTNVGSGIGKSHVLVTNADGDVYRASFTDFADLLEDGLEIDTSQITDWATATADFLTTSDIGSTVADEGHTHTLSDITDFPSSSFSGTLNVWLNGTLYPSGEVTVNPTQIVISDGMITSVSVGNTVQIV